MTKQELASILYEAVCFSLGAKPGDKATRGVCVQTRVFQFSPIQGQRVKGHCGVHTAVYTIQATY